MEEEFESWRRIMDKESWSRYHGGGIMEEALRRHLGSIWETSGRHLGGISIKASPLSNGMQKLLLNVTFTMCF